MTDDQIYQLVAQGGIGVVALGVIGKIAMRVAERMITAIDALAKEARDAGKATVEALGQLAERVSRIEGKAEIIEQWSEDETSEVRRIRERSEGSATGYGPMKPQRR